VAEGRAREGRKIKGPEVSLEGGARPAQGPHPRHKHQSKRSGGGGRRRGREQGHEAPPAAKPMPLGSSDLTGPHRPRMLGQSPETRGHVSGGGGGGE
jgi:hypothetical protein